MAKKRTKKRAGRGLSGAEASVKHLSQGAYEQLLRRTGLEPLARGACRSVRVKVGAGKSAQLCRLPTGPVLIVGRKAS